MVLFSGTFLKSDITSNETISHPRGTFSFLMCLTNVFVFRMVHSEVSNSDNNLTRYFAVSYVNVPIFDNIFDIGRSGNSSTLLVEIICILPVP